VWVCLVWFDLWGRFVAVYVACFAFVLLIYIPGFYFFGTLYIGGGGGGGAAYLGSATCTEVLFLCLLRCDVMMARGRVMYRLKYLCT